MLQIYSIYVLLKRKIKVPDTDSEIETEREHLKKTN